MNIENKIKMHTIPHYLKSKDFPIIRCIKLFQEYADNKELSGFRDYLKTYIKCKKPHSPKALDLLVIVKGISTKVKLEKKQYVYPPFSSWVRGDPLEAQLSIFTGCGPDWYRKLLKVCLELWLLETKHQGYRAVAKDIDATWKFSTRKSDDYIQKLRSEKDALVLERLSDVSVWTKEDMEILQFIHKDSLASFLTKEDLLSANIDQKPPIRLKRLDPISLVSRSEFVWATKPVCPKKLDFFTWGMNFLASLFDWSQEDIMNWPFLPIRTTYENKEVVFLFKVKGGVSWLPSLNKHENGYVSWYIENIVKGEYTFLDEFKWSQESYVAIIPTYPLCIQTRVTYKVNGKVDSTQHTHGRIISGEFIIVWDEPRLMPELGPDIIVHKPYNSDLIRFEQNVEANKMAAVSGKVHQKKVIQFLVDYPDGTLKELEEYLKIPKKDILYAIQNLMYRGIKVNLGKCP